MMKQRQARRTDKGDNRFASVPEIQNPRSVFNRSHGVTMDLELPGYLYPFLVDELLPGDTIALKPNTFARMATPLRPIMSGLHFETFFFAVPYRLLWLNFKKFMGEQTNPGDSTDFLVPQVTAPPGGWTENSLADYMGIPPGVDGSVNALPFRAMIKVWNEWFRDENLQDSIPELQGDGPDAPDSYVLLQRGKRKDYLSGALPFAQKGPEVIMPLGSTAPVIGSTGSGPVFDVGGTTGIISATGNFQPVRFDANATGQMDWSTTDLVTDLSLANGATVNQVRQAFQIQKLYERDARGGTRYIELVRSHFGVSSPDQRQQRPEFLGGTSTRMHVHPVAQVSAATPQGEPGDLSAFVTSANVGGQITYSATEHCVLLGLCMVRGDLIYQQGLHRMWSRSTRLDFYWPSLAHLGEQEVLSKEIFYDGTSADDDVWGYQPRYEEYRFAQNRVAGTMRSTHSTPLDVWHLGLDFAIRPTLNDAFIVENPPVDRVLAIPGETNFLLDAWFDIRHVRPMPAFGVPGLVDHF